MTKLSRQSILHELVLMVANYDAADRQIIARRPKPTSQPSPNI